MAFSYAASARGTVPRSTYAGITTVGQRPSRSVIIQSDLRRITCNRLHSIDGKCCLIWQQSEQCETKGREVWDPQVFPR